MKEKFTNSKRIRDLKYLCDIYKDLFIFLADKNPMLYEQLRQMWLEIKGMNLKIDNHAQRCLRNLMQTSTLIRKSARKIRTLHEKGEISSELYFILLFWLYKIFQYYGNSWYVLIDGVIFEGVMEEEAEKLLAKISSATKRKLLDLLDIIESASYSYTQISEKRKEMAVKELEEVTSQLRESKDVELADLFRKFIYLHSKLKYWQVEYAKVFSTVLAPTYDELLEGLSKALKELNIHIEGNMINIPWKFIPYVENYVLPELLKLE